MLNVPRLNNIRWNASSCVEPTITASTYFEEKVLKTTVMLAQ
jgi:hypothetical protein